MSTVSNIEGNEIIARYDGAVHNGGTTLIDDVWKEIMELNKGFKRYTYVEGVKNGIWTNAQLRYDADYNWIIPVTQKVIKELQNNIEYYDTGEPTEKSNKYDTALGRLTSYTIDLDMENVYKETIESIQLLNKLKEENGN